MTMHDYIRNELAAYLSGDLDEASQSAVREHLGTCQACGRELESLRNVWQSLGRAPDEVPGQRMSERFYNALNAYENSIRGASDAGRGVMPGAGQRGAAPGIQGWIDRLGWLIPGHPATQFALVLAVLVVGGFIGYALRGNGARTDEMAQLREEVRSVNRLLIVSLLQQQSAAERLQGVSWSYKTEGPDPEITGVLLQTLSQDPNVNVRLAALDALSKKLDDPAVRTGLVRALDKQSSPLLQLAMVDVVVQSDIRESGDALRELMRKPGVNETVKKKIEEALQHLST